LLAVDADESNWADADLLVDSLATIVCVLRVAVGWGNAFDSFV
jgi:hypothetical protein